MHITVNFDELRLHLRSIERYVLLQLIECFASLLVDVSGVFLGETYFVCQISILGLVSKHHSLMIVILLRYFTMKVGGIGEIGLNFEERR